MRLVAGAFPNLHVEHEERSWKELQWSMSAQTDSWTGDVGLAAVLALPQKSREVGRC